MEQEFAFIAKVEILRNVIKTHTVVLLLGWHGAGKTGSALRAVKGLWKPYYFNAVGMSLGLDMRKHNDDVTVLVRLDGLPVGTSADEALIIDDFGGAAAEVIEAVKKIILERSFAGKIIITAETQPKLEEFGSAVDAVVRMKEDTAQVLYTHLLDMP